MRINLIILDGFGLSLNQNGNAIANAKKPTINEFEQFYPFISLQAGGIAVGLSWNEPGNSEVGHASLGAGRIIYQPLLRINNLIKEGTFYHLPAMKKIVEHLSKNNSSLHLMGLVGSGSVHSYLEHLFALLDFARMNNLKNVYLHLFTDGRDSSPNEGIKIIKMIQEKCNQFGVGRIATIIGRYYSMDRDEDWPKIERAYKLLVEGEGREITNPIVALQSFYEKGIFDEFIEPLVLNSNGRIKDGDAVVFFNFREDSERELSSAFIRDNFDKFKRRKLNNLLFSTMTNYDKTLPANVILPPYEIKNTLGEILNYNGKSQLRIAETEKYAHVTFFFNNGHEEKFNEEERVLIPSLPINRIEKNPEMKAREITDKFFEMKKSKNFDFALLNFANPDMLGHSGNYKAAIKGIEVIDECLAKIYKFILERDEILIITADHGNAEQMINLETGEIDTEHNLNPVPLYIIANKYRRNMPRTQGELERVYLEPEGILPDVAPTILDLFKIAKPNDMTGNSLIEIMKLK